jgi:hypothetical protein
MCLGKVSAHTKEEEKKEKTSLFSFLGTTNAYIGISCSNIE